VSLCRTLWSEEDWQKDAERLLIVEEWGVWPSGEHPPLFMKLRSAFGEARPMIEAPGHLCRKDDADDGLSFLILCALFLWDCTLYKDGGGMVFVSHDEYGVVVEPLEDDMSRLRSRLQHLNVL